MNTEFRKGHKALFYSLIELSAPKELEICVCYYCFSAHKLGCIRQDTPSDIQAVNATSD